MSEMRRDLVLVVDSDKRTAGLLTEHFQELHLDIAAAATGEEAWRAAHELRPSAFILEVELPDTSGFDLCKKLSTYPKTAQTPIVFYSERDAEIDVVVGFEIGAWDYVSKSVGGREMALRINAMLKRKDGRAVAGAQRVGNVVLDFEQSTASKNGVRLLLSPMEFQILSALAKADGRVLRRAEIIEAAWPTDADVMGRTVDAHVKSLRAKLTDAGFSVATVRGIGYCLRPEPKSKTVNRDGIEKSDDHQDGKSLTSMNRPNAECRTESGR